MIKDHNLDDLIIDDNTPAKSKSKGILTIIALLITLLIVATIMTRIFLGESDQNSTRPEEKHTDIISPELKLDTAHKVQETEKKELDQLSNVMEEPTQSKPATQTNPLSLPQSAQNDLTKQDIAQVDESGSNNATIPSPAQSASGEPAKEIQDPLGVEAKNDDAMASDTEPKAENALSGNRQEESEPAMQNNQAQTPQTEEIPHETPEQKKSTPPVKKSPKQKQTEEKFSGSGSYYIQVGSFAKEPSRQFLSVITKNGFQYKLVNGKLLIGPYENDAAARNDLPNVKNKINKSAFIKH